MAKLYGQPLMKRWLCATAKKSVDKHYKPCYNLIIKDKEDIKMMNEKELRLWETMVEMGICTDEELGLATALCGTNIHTLENVLYIRTGYRSLKQMMEEDE